MPIPKYDDLMLPFLRVLADGQTLYIRDIFQRLALDLGLGESELQERIPSGQSTVFENRAGWARTYLKKSGLIEPETRANYRITSRGQEILASPPAKIDSKFLAQFPEFVAFMSPTKSTESAGAAEVSTESETPAETLDRAYQQIREELADELRQTLKKSTPAFFERVVLDVVVAMGYGGSLKDAGRAIGRSGDEGIDGVIKEDRLGLDVVYLQAKRWENPVGRPQIQAFAGSLEGFRARKGIFITTSQFTNEAREYVNRIEKRIVLIDGEALAEYMIDFGVGVTEVETYRIKRMDADYFE